jgi:gas vesicle protein
MSPESRGYSGGHVLAALVVGALAGAVVAYLTAPQSGRRTREQIKEAARRAGRRFEGAPEKARGAWQEAAEAAREAFEKVVRPDHLS